MLPNVDNVFLEGIFLPYYKDNVEPLEEECYNLSLKIHNNNDWLYKIFQKSNDKRRLKKLEGIYIKRFEFLSQISNRYYYG